MVSWAPGHVTLRMHTDYTDLLVPPLSETGDWLLATGSVGRDTLINIRDLLLRGSGFTQAERAADAAVAISKGAE